MYHDRKYLVEQKLKGDITEAKRGHLRPIVRIILILIRKRRAL